MITASPHRYRTGAVTAGRSKEVVDAALEQAAPVERAGLPAILTLRHLAHRMDFDYKLLRNFIAAKPGEFYREFVIRKRSGGGRSIAVPEPRLMAVQRWIVREILKLPPHPASHAYAKDFGHPAVRRAARRCWLADQTRPTRLLSDNQ